MDFKTTWKNSALLGGNNSLHQKYEDSRTKELWTRFGEAGDPAAGSFYQRLLAGIDKLLARTNSLPLDRLVCVAFAFYLPFEYVIRDVLGISFLASVWEELFIAAGLGVIYLKGRFDRANSVEVFIFLFMAVGLVLCMINRPYPSVAFAGLRAQIEYMIWFFILVRMFGDKKDVRNFLLAFMCVVLLMSFHGIYQFIIGVPIPSTWTSQTEMSVRTRVFSITGSPNIFGDLLLMAAPLCAALIYYLKDWRAKLAAFCATGVICLCMLFTFSKGAWVGLIVAIIIFALYIDRRILIAIGTAMAAILALVPSVTSRITYLFTNDYAEASAVGGRTMRWALGRQLLTENPWLGFGLGRYGGAVAMNNQILDKTEEFQYFYLDNYYLKTMVEMGYIGIIFFVLLLAVLLIFGLRAIYKAGKRSSTDFSLDPVLRWQGSDKVICVGIFSSLCGVLSHCFFENIFEEPFMMAYFWGLSAALIYLGFFEKDNG